MIAKSLQQWTDRRMSRIACARRYDLSMRERHLLNVLRQQTGVSARLLEAGYRTPAISQAAPHMMRMMLRILLPQVADEEIAAFDSRKANDLLAQWWAVTDAMLLSA